MLSQLITNVQDTENTLTLRYAKSIFSGRTHFGFLGPLFVGPMMSHRMQELLSFFALMVKSNLGSWILLAQKKKFKSDEFLVILPLEPNLQPGKLLSKNSGRSNEQGGF